MKAVTAASRYETLSSDRMTFLDSARAAARLSLPYLLPESGHSSGQKLPTPWQSLGAKGANVMASKLMLALFPVNVSFFKLQISDGEFVANPDLNQQIRAEADVALAGMEKIVNQQITGGMDRVVLTQAIRHAVVTGNGLLFDHRDGLKFYPLDRFVCLRDGNARATEIVTVEGIDKQFLPEPLQTQSKPAHVGADATGPSAVSDVTINEDEVLVYTWAKLKDGRWRWHQEVDGQVVPGSEGSCPADAPAWIPIRFNIVDGENYGRGRVEEFIGDLQSLEGLMQALVEGTAISAKILYLLNPGAVTKPAEFAKAQNGDILVGRPEDLVAVVTGKQADFATAYQMVTQLVQRLSEAFLILSVRQSERTTAEEVRAVQQEVLEQLGGILGTLTTELVGPYLRRKLSTLQRRGQLPKLPKGLVLPTVVAGLEGVGRGQDREALLRFTATVGQIGGPDVIASKINLDEFIKRLAAAEGIDPLGLIISPEQQAQMRQAAQQQQVTQSLVDQAGQFASSPLMDPTKNPNAAETIGIDPTAQAQGAPGAQAPAAVPTAGAV